MVKELEPSIPSSSFAPSIVRIKSARAIGLGFLVDDTHIVTCAHVVKDVLNLDDYPDECPSGTVTVDFPYANATERTAHVLIWRPRTPDEGRVNDIAVLVLDNRKPKAALPAPLLRPQLRSEELFGHTFLAFGYPAHFSEGIWSHGKMVWPLPNGLLQIENLPSSRIPIERGFSGTPVWDNELNGIVGMVVAASLRKKTHRRASWERE